MTMQNVHGCRLRFFSTTNAARDIHRVSNLFRERDQSIFLYAVSYGTYWLQRYLQIPYATHGTIIFSPMDKPLPDGGQTPCGMQLRMQFVGDPRGMLDLSRIDGVYPLEFDDTSENNQRTSEKYFGTTDMWDG